MNQHYFDNEDYFIIENYHKAKPFSSFLPGIAGIYGTPIWAFYVNRGQGISGFGIKDKNNPIMEFFPANCAYQYVGTYGFRTFIKCINQDKSKVLEPFVHTSDNNKRSMGISKSSFYIEEELKDEGLKIRVMYGSLMDLPFGGLIRRVTIQNTGLKKQKLEVLDGMPALLPSGVENQAFKSMSNLMQSWMDVEEKGSSLPFYKLRSSTKDEAKVDILDSGYFYINESVQNPDVLTIYDPQLIFRYRTDLQVPIGFIQQSLKELLDYSQVSANQVPCAFQLNSMNILPGESQVIDSIIGYSDNYNKILSYSKEIQLTSFVDEQFTKLRKYVHDICKHVETKTAHQLFDQYIEQCFLDNILRGGYPLILKSNTGSHVFHVFSRKHGDQERDYNFFSLEPSYYSQGNGNFRDVNQNRRNDCIFEPEVEDFNVWMFYSLIQADGYNPLSIQGSYFTVSKEFKDLWISELQTLNLSNELIDKVEAMVYKSYTPGQLATLLQWTVDKAILTKIVSLCLKYSKQHINADFGEGFWSDHFSYNQDLIENYLYIYPDKLLDLLVNRWDYGIFHSSFSVLPRDQKYCLTTEGKIRQYNAIRKRKTVQGAGVWIKDDNEDKIHTNLLNKMLIMVYTKFMNMDPMGMGIEMEADRPGWNDALNGLPGLLGSGMSETVELKRIVSFLINSLDTIKKEKSDIEILADVVSLGNSIADTLLQKEPFERWKSLGTIKDKYRESIENKMSSNHLSLSLDSLSMILSGIDYILNEGIKKANQVGNGLLPSYFVLDDITYNKTGLKTEEGWDLISITSCNYRPLPFFLEAPARYLKIISSDLGRPLYNKIRSSGIYDHGLSMYKTSESLEKESMEIGRIRAFTAGWQERESVFMHMTYKYLLGLLHSGLYEEFFEDLKYNFIPFLNPEVYGRPTTENSSFVASSCNPNPSIVGQGFVARLSGSTAEALHIWILMMLGPQGFTVENQLLTYRFQPILSRGFFNEEGKVQFKLFGTTRVTYINESKKDTFGEDKAIPYQVIVDGKHIQLAYLQGDHAEMLRQKKIKRMTVYFK